MTVENLSRADFESTILQNSMVIVDFWAPWCGPCRAFAPAFEQSAQNHPEIAHAKIDTDAERELAAIARIRSIPTIMAFRDGILVYSQPGAMPPAALENLIGQLKSLDMASLRARIADRESNAKT